MEEKKNYLNMLYGISMWLKGQQLVLNLYKLFIKYYTLHILNNLSE